MEREELEGIFKTFVLYVHLPRFLFPLIEIAEKNTPEAKNMFNILLKLKLEFFNEKPTYNDEDNYSDETNDYGPAELLEGVDYAEDIARSTTQSKNGLKNGDTKKKSKSSYEIPTFSIPNKEESSKHLLWVIENAHSKEVSN